LKGIAVAMLWAVATALAQIDRQRDYIQDSLMKKRPSWISLVVPIALVVGLSALGIVLSCGPSTVISPGGTTSDTTSSNFVWTVDTIAYGYAFGTCILNDTNIWVCGKFNADDTGGFSAMPRSIARFVGGKWLYRMNYQYQGLGYDLAAASADDIWFAVGALVHWDGKKWTESPADTLGIGWDVIGLLSKDTVYAGNHRSKIVRIINGNVEPVSIATDLAVSRIIATHDSAGHPIVFALLSAIDSTKRHAIYRIDGLNAHPVMDDLSIPRNMSDFMCVSGKTFFLCGAGIYVRPVDSDTAQWARLPDSYTSTWYLASIDCQNWNDIVVAGAYGSLAHFNGARWRQFPELSFPGNFWCVRIHDDCIVAVGMHENQHAIVARGRRMR
jgi:hypothetical protein